MKLHNITLVILASNLWLIYGTLHAMEQTELELGNEKSYNELNVKIQLTTLDIRIDGLVFRENTSQVSAQVTPHVNNVELKRFYTLSGARLHCNPKYEKTTLSINDCTAEVNLHPPTAQGNSQMARVGYIVKKHPPFPWNILGPDVLGSGALSLSTMNGGDCREVIHGFALLKAVATWTEHTVEN